MEFKSENSQRILDNSTQQNFDSNLLTKQTQSSETVNDKTFELKPHKRALVKSSLSISDLWAAVQDGYDSEMRHQEFILACNRVGCLYYASQKYARILNISPTESIALKMQGQIEALGTRDRLVKGAEVYSTRPSKVSSFIAIIGLVIASLGFISLNFRNLVGVGISIFVMAAGLRYFVSKPM